MTDTQTEPQSLNGTASTPEAVPVHVALSRVMADVQAVGKTGHNESQNFNFRGIDAVVNAVGPAFRRHGVICLPSVTEDSTENYTTGKYNTLMRRVMLRVAFTFVGPDGSTLTAETMGEAADAGDKAASKAHSVAYRTCLLQALCIPTNEPDPDEGEQYPANVLDAAQELGWTDMRSRADTWDELRARLGALSPEAAHPVREWIGETGVKLATFSPAVATELTRRLADAENRSVSDPTPETASTPPESPEGPQAAPEDPIRTLLAATSPSEGDVAGWLIGVAKTLQWGSLRKWYRDEGEELSAGSLEDQRRAWALSVHDRVAVASVRVLSGFGLSAEACEAVER